MKVALDVNNVCQLRCTHCYLPADQRHQVTPPWVLESVANYPVVEEVVVVGMEPFFNKQSVDRVQQLIDLHPRVSIITNGVNPEPLKDLGPYLENIDISMDAGPMFWNDPTHGRGAVGAPTFTEWATAIKQVRKQLKHVVALNTLSAANCSAEKIDDMLKGAAGIFADEVMFSIFVPTDPTLTPGIIGLEQAVNALAASEQFRVWGKDVYLLVDRYHLDTERLLYSKAKDLISKSTIRSQIILLPEYPHEMGFVRVNTNGQLLTSYDALFSPLGDKKPRCIQLKVGDLVTPQLNIEAQELSPYQA